MPMNSNIEGEAALVNAAGEETTLKAGDFALVDPSEKHQYRNKEEKPFIMICGVPKRRLSDYSFIQLYQRVNFPQVLNGQQAEQ